MKNEELFAAKIDNYSENAKDLGIILYNCPNYILGHITFVGTRRGASETTQHASYGTFGRATVRPYKQNH